MELRLHMRLSCALFEIRLILRDVMGSSARRASRQDLQGELRKKGLRATASRLAILQVLRTASSPVSHGEVADELSSFGWDRTTIYRNLLDLTRVGLARRLDLGDHIWRFEPATRVSAGPRSRFICTQCGSVRDLVGVRVAADKGADVPMAVRRQRAEVQLRGVCDRCSANDRETDAS